MVSPSVSSALFKAFRRRWLLASTLGLLVGGFVGALLWSLLPEQYSAEVRLRIPAPDRASAGGSTSEEEIARFQRAQAALIQSSTVLEAVLRQPEVAELPTVQRERDPLAWLENHLTVEGGSLPGILSIRVTSANADETAVLARAIVEVYVREVAGQREASLRRLKEARGKTEETLRQKRQRLAQLENTRLGAAEKECQQARFDLRVARAQLAAQERRRTEVDRVTVKDAAVLAYLKEDALNQKLSKELTAAEEQIKQLIRVSVLKEGDPRLLEFQRVREEAKQKQERRRKEVVPIVEQQMRMRASEEYQTRVNQLRERAAFYEGLVKSLEEEVQKLGGAAAGEESRTLREEIATDNETLRKLTVEIARAENPATIPSVVSASGEMPAVQPKNPQRRWQLAGLGGAGSCALFVLALSWQELRLRRITSGSDIIGGLGLPVVGNIPNVRSGRKTTLKDLEEQGSISEAVDALRTVLLRDSGNGPRLLLVTSAIGREGKTALAVRLAASLARAWRKTLFIDADLRKPEAHTLFDMPLEPGLSEVLRGEADVSEIIQPTELSRLWMIPAGHWDAHAIQALAQDGAGGLFTRLKEQFDFIVIDACPVLPVADALLLCTHVNSVLLAVRSGVSHLPIVHAAQQRLATVEAPLRGVVLMGPDADLHG